MVSDIARTSRWDPDHRYIFRGILSFCPLLSPPLRLLLLSPPLPHKPQTSEITQFHEPLTVPEYTTFGSSFPSRHARPSISSAIHSIANYVFLVKSLSTVALMSLLSILGFKCNAVNFFCCAWHITRIPEDAEVRQAPITTQPTPQEPMTAKPRGTPFR